MALLNLIHLHREIALRQGGISRPGPASAARSYTKLSNDILYPPFPSYQPSPSDRPRSRPGREAAKRTLDGEDRSGIIEGEGKGGNRYREVAPDPRPAVESISWTSSEGFCHEKSEMKSKISIWDCRRAIDIKGGLPLTMRGDLFDVDRPSAASVARWPPVKLLVTQLEVKQGQWLAGNIVFTRSGQEHLTKLARDIIIADKERYATQQSDPDLEG